MKSVRELTSLALNAVTLMIPVVYTYRIVFSQKSEEESEEEVDKASSMLYNVVIVVALSLILNSKKIMKLGTI